jgi:hypothetical protein
MENLPSYMQAWQVFSQITNKIVSQDFLTYYYSDLIFAGYFSDFIWVQENVLSSYTLDQKHAIYYDNQFGMQSLRNLTVWVDASRGNEVAKTTLQNHYFSGTDLLLTA